MVKIYLGGLLFVVSSWAMGKGTLELGQSHVLNENVSSDSFTSYGQFEHELKARSSRDTFYKHSFAVRKYNNDRSPLYSLSELYVSRHYSDSVNVSLGRKKIFWDAMGDFWSMGEVQANRGFNLLEDQREGLFGLHMRKSFGIVYADMYISPLSIPSTGAGLDFENGQVVRNSEWSELPPRFVVLENQKVPIFYNVRDIDYGKLLIKPSYAGRIGIKAASFGDISLYGGRKPEPGVRVSATGLLNLDDQERVDVDVNPFRNMQNFLGGTFKKSITKNLKFIAGYEYINPERGIDDSYEIAGLKIRPNYYNISYASAALIWKRYKDFFSLQTIRSLKNYQDSDATFSKKMRFENAVGLSFNSWLTEKLLLFGKIQRDTRRNDTLVSSGGRVFLARNFSGSLLYQYIDTKTDNSYWSVFRENDLWRASLNYSF